MLLTFAMQKEVFDQLRGERVDLDFRWDVADVAIDKLLVPGDRDEKDLSVFPWWGRGLRELW